MESIPYTLQSSAFAIPLLFSTCRRSLSLRKRDACLWHVQAAAELNRLRQCQLLVQDTPPPSLAQAHPALWENSR